MAGTALETGDGDGAEAAVAEQSAEQAPAVAAAGPAGAAAMAALVSVVVPECAGGRITAVRSVLNPDKLAYAAAQLA